MSSSSRPRLRGLCVIFTLSLLLAVVPAASADPASTAPTVKAPIAQKGTYIALGDSLAFGYQSARVGACAPTGCTSPDTQFNTGYVDVFAGLFGADYPGVKTVNLGCPGETSATLINATNATTGCTTYPFAIHSGHPGQTQLEAAVHVIQEAGKNTSPVTIDIGANDVLALRNACTTAGATNLTCVQAGAPAAFATVESNLDATLDKLRAEGGKNLEIIVVGLYNPLYVPIFFQSGAGAAAGTDALTNQLNSLTAATAAKYKALFVDPMATFNPGNGTNPPLELGTLQALTGIFSGDIHPTDAGYAALGALVRAGSGF
jgi:lysophospholipase L1-like esterase